MKRGATRILRGARPAQLPIAQPTRIEPVIEPKSASAIGAELPRSMRRRAVGVLD